MTEQEGRVPVVPVDFLIITPLPEERDAVLRKLPGHKKLPPSEEDIYVYFQADLPADSGSGSYRIIIMSLLGMGRVQASTPASAAIQRWKPHYVLLVGIAGGVGAKGVRLGDVLIPDRIVDYELQKQTAEGSDIRWEVYNVSPRLLSAAKSITNENWLNLIDVKRPHRGKSKPHIDPVASGDKVVDFAEALEKYRQTWSKLIGVEMEAGGVAVSAFQAAKHTQFFMIRGVSDLADGDKNAPSVKLWRSYACDVAASYTVAFLRSGPVPFSSTSDYYSESNQGSPIIEIEPPGGTMPPDSKLYIERTADNECWQYIRSPTPYGVTLFIQAPRQMGKSSLICRIIDQAKRKLSKPSVFIDFQEFPKEYFVDTDEENFLIQFCLDISDALDIEERIDQYWQGRRTNLAKCGDYLSKYVIPTINEPFILALDEVNRLTSSPFRNNFFGMLRTWHNSRAYDENFRRMTLFLSSSVAPSLLIDDPNQSPFNVARRVSLSDFTRIEVVKLNEYYGSPLNQNQISKLMTLINGHPFLTSLAFYQLTTGKFSIDTLVMRATEETGPFAEHLSYYLNIILEKANLKQLLLRICRGTTIYEEQRVFRELRGLGLIRKEGKQAVFRNELYRRYFKDHLND